MDVVHSTRVALYIYVVFYLSLFFVCLLVNYKVFSQERNLTLETVFLAENYF